MMEENQNMEKVLSEKQLQGIYGGSEKDEMKAFGSSHPLGGTSSWLNGLEGIQARAISSQVQHDISAAIEHRQQGETIEAQQVEDRAERLLQSAHNSVNRALAQRGRR